MILRNGSSLSSGALRTSGATLLTLTILLSLAHPAGADVVFVDAGGGGDYLTIQEGLDAAAPGDTVLVAPGTYSGPLNRNLDFRGLDKVLRSQAGPDLTHIDCGGSSANSRGLHFYDGESPSSVVEGFTIENGYVADRGGGICCVDGSSPSIVDCVFLSNHAADAGGMLAVDGATPSITGCLFQGNYAYGCAGAFWGDGIVFVDCSFIDNHTGDWVPCVFGYDLSFTRCRFAENSAQFEGDGGGVSCRGVSEFEDCFFTSNYGWAGGAIYAEGIVSAVRCTFDTNQAERGGAVLSFGPRASFSECVFSGNSASTPEGTGRGGAAFCFSLIPGEQEVSFSRCIFLGNHAELQGGALHISGCLGSVTDCVFGGNYVADGVPSSMGGALNIYYELPHPPPPPSPPDPLLVDHCTFSANAGDHGGSISCGGDLAPDVSRSIIAFGEGSEGIYCDGVSPFVTQCCVYGNAGGDSLCGVEANNLFLDPAFCDAGALDFTVRGDSPCLAENNPWGELLGALGQGCPAAAGIDESGGGAELSLRARGFNPFADAGTVAYAVPYEGAPLRVSVYSLTGRLVRVLHDGPSPSTAGTLRWNGRNAAGELVGSGVYFCRAVCGSETAAAKLVLVR